MLPKSLMLRRTTDTSFAMISDFFPRNIVPFVSPPVNPFQATQVATANVAGGAKAATKAAAKPAVPKQASATVRLESGIQQQPQLATPAQQHAARQQQQQPFCNHLYALALYKVRLVSYYKT